LCQGVLPNQIIARVLALFEAGEFVRVCAWCARVNLDDDWLPMPQVALDAIHVRERITHSICPDCTQALLAELREPNATR
jgi:hypothetical protein